jgi:branched-chain amino acid transport system substrate-binding protein
MMMKPLLSTIAATLALLAGAGQAQTQGVTKDELVVGTIQDLSGPVAAFGKAVRQGMQLRVDEINEQGGINGRKIKLIAEDNGYDPKKAVLAAQKLVNQDKVFAVLGHIGTSMNNAAMPIQFEKNIVNFFPVTAAREMYEPAHKLKFAFSVSYYDQMRTWLPKMAKEKNVKKVCALYQDDEFGLEVIRGAEAGLKTINMEMVEKTSYKRGATDFSSQVARLKGSGCELVVLGTIIRETIGAIGESRKTGFSPIFIASTAGYTELIHKLGGKAMDGLYAAMAAQVPYVDDPSQPLRFWANKFKTKFNEDPTLFAAYGYSIMDAFGQAATKAGTNLTTESFVRAMETMKLPPDIFGTPEATFSPTKRLGNNASRMSQIVDGKWKVVADYARPD